MGRASAIRLEQSFHASGREPSTLTAGAAREDDNRSEERSFIGESSIQGSDDSLTSAVKDG